MHYKAAPGQVHSYIIRQIASDLSEVCICTGPTRTAGPGLDTYIIRQAQGANCLFATVMQQFYCHSTKKVAQ